MTKDAEQLLKYILDKSKKHSDTEVSIKINEIKNIPNIEISPKELLNDLKTEKVISDYKEILGELYVYLTIEGQEYFEKKGNRNTMDGKGVVINLNGGQIALAKDSSTIFTTQNNGVIASDKEGQDKKNIEPQNVVIKKAKSCKMVRWATRKQKIILLIILLMTVLAGALVINFSKLTKEDKKMDISNQEFAEDFCEEIKEVLLASDEGQIKEVKTMLDDLKEECDGDVNLEERYIYTLSECGLFCCQQGDIYDASIFTSDALTLAKEFELSKDNCDLFALCYSNSATVLLEQGNYIEAESFFLKAIECYEDFGMYNIKLALTYMDLANYYIDGAEYAEALENVERAEKVLKQLNNSNSIQMGLLHIIRAKIYQHTDEKCVLDELLTAEDILVNNKPESNIYLASLYGDIGAYYRPQNIEIAEGYFKKELDIAKSMQGEFGEDTIDAEINLAGIASDYGRIQEAQSKLNSIAIKCEGHYSERKVDSAYAYVKLANIHRELGNYAKSISYYEEAINIFETEYGTNHSILATVYGSKAIALMESDWGQEDEAFICLDHAINILENNYADSQSDMAELLCWKAELYCEQGEFEEAVPLLEEAKRIYKMLYGSISDYVISIDLKIGNCYVMLRNENSYSVLYSAVARYESMYGEFSYRMIEPYIMLGDCFYYGLGEGNKESQKWEAMDYYNKAEEILEVFDNINTSKNAYLYKKLGTAWYMLHQDTPELDEQRKSDMRKALLCYKKAQDIYVIRQQEDSEENLWLTTRIGRIYAYLGEKDLAIECLEFVENRKDSINNENQQLTIYLDMFGICEVLNDRDKCKEYANFLKAIIESSPTAADAIDVECVDWINRYAD